MGIYDETDKLLDQLQSKLISDTRNQQTGDRTIQRFFPNIKKDEFARVQDRLAATLYYASGELKTQCQPSGWSGIWRVISNVASEQKGQEGVLQTLKLGRYTALLTTEAGGVTYAGAWSGIRLTEAIRANANDQIVTGVADAQTDNPNWIVFAKLTDIAPGSVHAVANAIDAYVEGSATGQLNGIVTIEGETYGATTARLKVLYVNPKIAEDGTGEVDVVLAAQRFCLKTFDDLATTNQRDTYLLSDVPQDDTQRVLDAWKALDPINGRGATASRNGTNRTCDLTLTAPSGVYENYSTGWIAITTEKKRRWHLAFGYTKAQMGAFLDSHDSPLQSGYTSANAPGNYPGSNGYGASTAYDYDSDGTTEEIIHKRDVDITLRSNGLYDALIVEEKFEDANGNNFWVNTVERVKMDEVDTDTWRYGFDRFKVYLVVNPPTQQDDVIKLPDGTDYWHIRTLFKRVVVKTVTKAYFPTRVDAETMDELAVDPPDYFVFGSRGGTKPLPPEHAAQYLTQQKQSVVEKEGDMWVRTTTEMQTTDWSMLKRQREFLFHLGINGEISDAYEPCPAPVVL